MTAILGLDLGQKRVGVAVADTTTHVATPVTTLMIRGRRHLLEQLEVIIKEYQVEKIVVGLPKNLNGEMGPAAKKITEEVVWLKANKKLDWVFWDERLSTQEVERAMLDHDVSHARRKEMRDQLAAQRILQNYLDYHRS
ncbi:MAG: Holliday junction resolvase RuvX [Candidatus Omnitrophica bacterium]|nr:Holliday junction resolvase RuvX [Candidatus Omnitrophota bacterium]